MRCGGQPTMRQRCFPPSGPFPGFGQEDPVFKPNSRGYIRRIWGEDHLAIGKRLSACWNGGKNLSLRHGRLQHS